MEKINHLLIDVLHKLNDDKVKTSMSVWISYWRARILLRELALMAHDKVVDHYLKKDMDVFLPSESFEEIADDITYSMKTIMNPTGDIYNDEE